MAYLLQDPDLREPDAMVIGTDLLTPVLSDRIAKDHIERGQKAIVVYPETVKGNPLGAQIVVRYLLNFPGLLGGDDTYGDDEIRFAYSDVLGKAAGCDENVLFIPPIDTRIFKPPPAGTKRSGSCFYADKYQKVHGGTLCGLTKDSVEILRGSERDQSSYEIAALLQTSELFFTYENTALAIEAVLCGCPAVFVPNPHLKSIIASAELGPEGYAWGADAEEIARATATVDQGARNYLKKIDVFEEQLAHFIATTQGYASRSTDKPRALALSRDLHVVTIGERESLVRTLLLLLCRALPARLEREIAKFCFTIGLNKAGSLLWKSAANRLPLRVVVRHSPAPRALQSVVPDFEHDFGGDKRPN